MKTKLSILFPVLVFFTLSSVMAQSVVIESGPDMRISDRDGKPEPIITERETGPTAVRRDERTIPGGLLPPKLPAGVRPTGPPPAPRLLVGPAGVAPRGDPAAPPQTLAEGEAGRLADLKLELGILETRTSAAFMLNMQNVFVAGAATIDAIADEKLTLIAEYLQLALAKEIRLTYHFAPSLHDEDLAWARSVAMIKWMTENGSLAESSFTIRNPGRVSVSTPTAAPGDGNLAAMRNRLVFNVIFR